MARPGGTRRRVHLRSKCNYLSSLLATYTPPEAGEPPFLINGWRSTSRIPPPGEARRSATNQEVSPYRVTYGIHNPALRGLVLTPDTVVPNFSWTPRMVLSGEDLSAVLSHALPLDLLVLPAVNGNVVRLFCNDGTWYLADSHTVDGVERGNVLYKAVNTALLLPGRGGNPCPHPALPAWPARLREGTEPCARVVLRPVHHPA